MPGKKRLRGASAKEQRQYEHILEDAKEEGRYGKRAKEVAARTVMKQHGEAGHQPHRKSAGGRSTRKSTAKKSSRSTTRKKSSATTTRRKTSSRGSHRGRSSGSSSRRRSGSNSNRS